MRKIRDGGCQRSDSRPGWAVLHCIWALALLSMPLLHSQATGDGLKRGLALSQEGQIAEALLAFDSFKQANPGDPRPYLYSGLALIQAGHLKDAALDLDGAAARRLRDAGDVLAYARARSQLGDLEDASRALAEVEDSTRL
ncbi:MAG: hypothetical protein V3T83_11855, partial [Acidobacteriota bacterium]